MIKAKEAVQIARDQMREWFAEDGVQDLELEEVALSDDERLWFITLGSTGKRANPTASEVMSAPEGSTPKSIRIYKVFSIDAESGEIRAMEQRKS